MQLTAMRQYVRKRWWMVAMEVQEVASGAKEHPARQGLIDGAKRREVNAIVVWRLDRWGRSLPDLVTTLRALTAVDVGFVSLSEALASLYIMKGAAAGRR